MKRAVMHDACSMQSESQVHCKMGSFNRLLARGLTFKVPDSARAHGSHQTISMLGKQILFTAQPT
jgi:hypothetical protein